MIGKQCALFSHDGFRRFLTITGNGEPESIDGRKWATFETNEGSRFYVKPELGTGRCYNVGNRAFWIVVPYVFPLE